MTSKPLVHIDGLAIAIDRRSYGERICAAIEGGRYELHERELVKRHLECGDRVIDIGTAIGVVAMTAARVVGPDRVLAFDANHEILLDAGENFARNALGAIATRFGALKNKRQFAPGEVVDFIVFDAFWASRLRRPADDSGATRAIKTPTYCLEDEIAAHRANVLLCDIEGGEVDLFMWADLTGISLIIVETHRQFVGDEATVALVDKIMGDGFHLLPNDRDTNVLVFRRERSGRDKAPTANEVGDARPGRGANVD